MYRLWWLVTKGNGLQEKVSQVIFFLFQSFLKLDHQLFCRETITCQIYKFPIVNTLPSLDIATENGLCGLVMGVEGVRKEAVYKHIQRVFGYSFQSVFRAQHLKANRVNRLQILDRLIKIFTKTIEVVNHHQSCRPLHFLPLPIFNPGRSAESQNDTDDGTERATQRLCPKVIKLPFHILTILHVVISVFMGQ